MTDNFNKLCSRLLRFPLSIISAIILTIYALDFDSHNPKATYIVSLSIFGCFWFVSSVLLTESYKFNKLITYLFSVPIFAALSWLAWTHSLSDAIFLASISFLLMFIAPFIGKKIGNEQIWMFNYNLIKNILFTIILAIVLFSGVMLIGQSLKSLFDYTLPDIFSFKKWLNIVVLLFSPIYALTNMPKDFSEKTDKISLEALRILLTYIFMPLAAIYMAVLYVYFINILIEYKLPNGLVTYIVSGFACLVIFSYLAAYPLTIKQNKVISWFFRYFFLFLIMPIAVMSIAIWERVAEYGITQSRYAVIAWAIWLVIILLFELLATKTNSIKNIIQVAIILLIISFYGPLSAKKVSIYSQTHRLHNLLAKNHMIDNGLMIPGEKKINLEDAHQISAIVNYLIQNNQQAKLKALFANIPQSHINTQSTLVTASILKDMGIKEDLITAELYSSRVNINFSDILTKAILIKDYDIIQKINYNNYAKNIEDKTVIQQNLQSFFDPANNSYNVVNQLSNDQVIFDIFDVVKQSKINEHDYEQTLSSNKLKVKLIVNNLYGHFDQNKFIVENFSGYLLIKISN